MESIEVVTLTKDSLGYTHLVEGVIHLGDEISYLVEDVTHFGVEISHLVEGVSPISQPKKCRGLSCL